MSEAGLALFAQQLSRNKERLDMKVRLNEKPVYVPAVNARPKNNYLKNSRSSERTRFSRDTVRTYFWEGQEILPQPTGLYYDYKK